MPNFFSARPSLCNRQGQLSKSLLFVVIILLMPFSVMAQTPTAPTGVLGIPGDTALSIKWTAVSGATGYNIKQSTVTGGPYSTVGFSLGSVGCHHVISPQAFLHNDRLSQVRASGALLPDMGTRQQIKTVQAAQVTKMVFYGPDYLRFENDPIIITNPKKIRQFLLALSHAEAPYLGTADQADTLLIYTKSCRTSRDALRFNFYPRFASRCYGQEFYRVLHTTHELQTINIRGRPT